MQWHDPSRRVTEGVAYMQTHSVNLWAANVIGGLDILCEAPTGI